MQLKMIEELGDLLCEAIEFANENLGFKSLDKANKICKAVLPDLEHLDDSAAGKLASAAYDMAQRVKKALGS